MIWWWFRIFKGTLKKDVQINMLIIMSKTHDIQNFSESMNPNSLTFHVSNSLITKINGKLLKHMDHVIKWCHQNMFSILFSILMTSDNIKDFRKYQILFHAFVFTFFQFTLLHRDIISSDGTERDPHYYIGLIPKYLSIIALKGTICILWNSKWHTLWINCVSLQALYHGTFIMIHIIW